MQKPRPLTTQTPKQYETKKEEEEEVCLSVSNRTSTNFGRIRLSKSV